MNQTNITIPKPCHANWATMDKNEQGRHCAACNKTVVDFTTKSDTEIRNYLTENSEYKVCGHFKTSQVVPVKKQQLFNFKAFNYLSMLLVGLTSTLFSCESRTTGEPSTDNRVEQTSEGSETLLGDTVMVEEPPVKGKVEVIPAK